MDIKKACSVAENVHGLADGAAAASDVSADKRRSYASNLALAVADQSASDRIKVS